MKYFIDNSTWLDITPEQMKTDGNYGMSGLAVDVQRPGTVMVAPLNQWYPDAKYVKLYKGVHGRLLIYYVFATLASSAPPTGAHPGSPSTPPLTRHQTTNSQYTQTTTMTSLAPHGSPRSKLATPRKSAG
jgi:hypothetical protein